MKIHVIGDVHGKVLAYSELLRDLDEGYTVQVGDFGHADAYERAENTIDGLGERHHFFGGNHDEYPQMPDWDLGDYGTLPFCDNAFFVRGAHSIDRDYRTAGVDWWPEEQISQYRHSMILEDYKEAEPKLVLSHDGPAVAVTEMFPDKHRYMTTTGHLLDRMWSAHQPDAWVFGHWHEDRRSVTDDTVFVCLDELEHVTARI
jgi:hypothetical protein